MNSENHTKNIYEVIERSGGFPVHSSHRGGCRDFGPENTMHSFRKCVSHGTRLIEIDLRVTKDLHLVLMHDEDVDRTTNGSGCVSDFTLDEIRSLDAAYYYPDLRGKGIQVPMFQEFLDEFISVEDLLFMLDFKDTVSIEMTLKVVAERQMYHRVLLGSVLLGCNNLLAQLKPPHVPLITDISATVSIMSLYFTGFLKWYTFQHSIFGFILNESTAMFWSKGLVEALHKEGLKVLVCGEELDKEDIIRQCIDYGVDFIMSDRPDVLKETLNKFATNELIELKV